MRRLPSPVGLVGAALADFTPAARRYVLTTVFLSGCIGAYTLLLNLYLLELGYDPAFLGVVAVAQTLAIAIASFPIGLLGDRIGRAPIALAAATLMGLGIAGQAFWTTPLAIYALNFCFGAGTAAYEIIHQPYMSENSSPRERQRLFSLGSITSFVGMSAGQLVGAFLPNVVPGATLPTDEYRGALVGVALIAALGVIPMLGARPAPPSPSTLRPLGVLRGVWGVTGMLIVVAILNGLGYGLMQQFMNLYFVHFLGTTREQYGAIASIALLGNLVGPLCAPAVARRWGTLTGWMLCRALMGALALAMALVPLVGVAAVALWMRGFLFALSAPLFGVFQMEIIEPRSRAAANALRVIGLYGGIAAGAGAAGTLIVSSGYQMPLVLAALSYVLLAATGWAFFGRRAEAAPGRPPTA